MFDGFGQEALNFLTDIRFHNTPAFFETNRKLYETAVKAPLRELAEEMTDVIHAIDPALDTRPARVMSRIRRDTRYSRDQSPFRDHVWLDWRYPGESRSEGFNLYWGFGPDWISWGCGCYGTQKPMLDALRLCIRREPDTVRAALFAPALGDRFALYGEDYRRLTVPDDVPDDLRAVYTKRGFGVECKPDPQHWALLQSHAMADQLAHDLRALAPLQKLMRRMRAEAEHAQQEQARERQEKAAAPQETQAHLTVRAAEDFDF